MNRRAHNRHHHLSREERHLKMMLSAGIALCAVLSYLSMAMHEPNLGHAATALGIAVNIRWVWT